MIDLLKGYFKKCLFITMTLFVPLGIIIMAILLLDDEGFDLSLICLISSISLSFVLARILYVAKKIDDKNRFLKIIGNKIVLYDKNLMLVDEKEFINISFKNSYFNWVLTFLFDYKIPESLIVTLPDNTELKLGHLFKKDYIKFIINESVNNK